MLAKHERLKPPFRKTPYTLQMYAARTLVNSDHWVANLDQFYNDPHWETLPAVVTTLHHLFMRVPSESELKVLMIALNGRFKALRNIDNIRSVFGVPDDITVTIVFSNDKQVDKSKTLEPIKDHFVLDFSNLQQFKILLDLEYDDIILKYLEEIPKNEDITIEHFSENILEMYYYAIKSDYTFISRIIIPQKILEDFSYQRFYGCVFLRLMKENANFTILINIWNRIRVDLRFQVLCEGLDEETEFDVLWSFMIPLFPEDWQNHETFLNFYYSLFLCAMKHPVKYTSLLCSLAGVVENNLSILYEALHRCYVLSPRKFSKVINIYLVKLNHNMMGYFISENLFLFFEQAVIDNNLRTLKLVWDMLSEFHHLEMTKWLNDHDNYYLDHENMADFILPKLTQENQQKMIIQSISRNSDNYFLVRYLFPKLSQASRIILKQKYESDRPDLYDYLWLSYLKAPGLDEIINDIIRALEFMFGKDYAEDYLKSYLPIITMIQLLRNPLLVFKVKWAELNQVTKTLICGPLLFCLFHEVEKEDCGVIDFILHGITGEEITLIERELKKRQKRLVSKYAFSYWVEKYASAEFIADFDRDDLDFLVGFEDGNFSLTFKILDALYQYSRLDRLQLNLEVNYNNLIICGGDLLFLPYIIKGLITVFPIHIEEQTGMDIFAVLSRSLGGGPTTVSLNRAIRIYASIISRLVKNHDEKSLAKLDYFVTAMISSNKLSPDDKAQAFTLLMTKLLSDRKNNPLLEGNIPQKPSLFSIKNPIDGQICRSEDERNLIILFNELKNQYPDDKCSSNHAISCSSRSANK